MPWNLARSLRRNLFAWCCYIALRAVRAHPALQGSSKGHDLAPDVHINHKDFVAPQNDHHGFNHGELVNHKRLRESQQVPHQVDPQLPNLGVDRDYLGIEPENGIRSTHVAKRPMTGQDGYFATTTPQSVNHDSDTSFHFGAATYDRSGLLEDVLAGNQSNHLQSSLFPSALSASLHSNFFDSEPMLPLMPPHEAGKPGVDLFKIPGLHNELLHSDFEKIPDSTLLSTFGNQAPSEKRTIQNLPATELPLESNSSHGLESAHGDLSVSQLSMQFDHIDDSQWPPPWLHSHWPEPQLTPQQSQFQFLLEHPDSEYDPHSTQHNFQGQASHQIQSHQLSEYHTYSQGLATSGSLLAQFTGDSSEKVDKNNGSVHEITEWDSELAALNIPDFSKDNNLVQKFINDFNHRACGKLDVKSLRQVDIIHAELKDLPVAFFKVSQSPLYLIRVLLAPEYRDPKSPKSFASQNYPLKISNHFYRLIHWLLFINTAVLRRLQAPGSMSEKLDEANSNGRLIDWFFQQTFEPSDSWPVVGTITYQVANAPGRKFGPIQKIIITCLSSPCKLNRELQSAVLLVRHYYEYQFPEILQAMGSGQLDDFKSLINNAIQSKMIIGNEFNKGNLIEKLGNFPVWSLKSIPKALQPASFYSILFTLRYKVKKGTEEEKLRKFIQHIMSSRSHCPILQTYRINFNPEDYPVLISNKGNDETVLKHGMIWPRDPKTDKSVRKNQIESRLKQFLDHLNVCLSKLMAYKENRGIQTEDGTEKLFFYWLFKILFNPGLDKLPLLGQFNLEKGRQADSFSAQDFNEIQALFHNIIANRNAHQRYFQAALSVLGYWLKNEQGGIYNQLFKNDDEYWDNLVHLIESEFYSHKNIRQ